MGIILGSKKGLRRFAVAGLAVALAAGCVRCAPKVGQADILTQKPTQPQKTQITVLVKHAFSINSFEEAVEKRFPEIDIVQVGSFTPALSPDEFTARMKHDDLTDIVMTWPLSFAQEYWEERLIDLSALPFTTRYNVSMLDSISQDGRLYYLPGPAQVRGIVYNKTLFEENGWTVPHDFNGFIALCQKIEESGIRAVQLGFENSEVLDTAFVGFGYAGSFATPKDAQWISDYIQGKGSFLDHFSGALDTFQLMIDQGIWKKEDLEIDYSEREQLFFSRQCAMIEDSVLLTRIGPKKSGSNDEFALMPFFNPGGEGNDWTRLYMVCYIGLNKHLTEPINEKKYRKVLEVMDYISTPEGQAALAGDTGTMYSSLKDVTLPATPETADILNALGHGRYAIFPEFASIQGTLREGLAGMVAGELTGEEVGKMMDEANAEAVNQQVIPEVLGSASEDFTLLETGNFITDAMREFAGCEIALFLDGGKDGRYNGKGVTARLYQGDVTRADIDRIMPDFKYGEKGELWKISMTGENLQKTLEYAVPVDNVSGWFYYFSGLRMKLDPTAEPGSRTSKITLTDRSVIEPERIYTLVVTENSVPEEYMISCEKTGVLLSDLLVDTVHRAGEIRPTPDNRFIFS